MYVFTDVDGKWPHNFHREHGTDLRLRAQRFVRTTKYVILKVQSQANPPAAEAPRLSEVRVNVIVTYGRESHVVMIFDVGSNG